MTLDEDFLEYLRQARKCEQDNSATMMEYMVVLAFFTFTSIKQGITLFLTFLIDGFVFLAFVGVKWNRGMDDLLLFQKTHA